MRIDYNKITKDKLMLRHRKIAMPTEYLLSCDFLACHRENVFKGE